MSISTKEFNSWNVEKRYDFLEEVFRSLHCSCGCGREIGANGDWVAKGTEILTADCFESLKQGRVFHLREMITSQESSIEFLQKELKEWEE